jgi:hypothetical protein
MDGRCRLDDVLESLILPNRLPKRSGLVMACSMPIGWRDSMVSR